MGEVGARVPTIDPTDALNRAREAQGVPHADTNPLNPTGVGLVDGIAVAGSDNPYTPLPETISPAARASLEAVSLTTQEAVNAATDAQLLELSGVGPAILALLRAAGSGG